MYVKDISLQILGIRLLRGMYSLHANIYYFQYFIYIQKLSFITPWSYDQSDYLKYQSKRYIPKFYEQNSSKPSFIARIIFRIFMVNRYTGLCLTERHFVCMHGSKLVYSGNVTLMLNISIPLDEEFWNNPFARNNPYNLSIFTLFILLIYLSIEYSCCNMNPQ